MNVVLVSKQINDRKSEGNKLKEIIQNNRECKNQSY